jgi:hypothetical protein
LNETNSGHCNEHASENIKLDVIRKQYYARCTSTSTHKKKKKKKKKKKGKQIFSWYVLFLSTNGSFSFQIDTLQDYLIVNGDIKIQRQYAL